jgi:hypothetical protein
MGQEQIMTTQTMRDIHIPFVYLVAGAVLAGVLISIVVAF